MEVTAQLIGNNHHDIHQRGAQAYVNVIAALLEVCRDFTVAVAEHAQTGDFTFIRWIATGTGPEGRFEFSGVDRVETRNGHVCENRIYSDDPLFARVAAKIDERRSPRGTDAGAMPARVG